MRFSFNSNPSGRRLYPRKGGGGKGGGGGAKAGGGGGTASSGKGGSSVSVSGSTGGSAKSATAYGGGGGRQTTIPAGQAFAGRTIGGGTRTDVYGSRTYGSGYPGYSGLRGVNGFGFPFVFWPVVWGTGFGYGPAYLHSNDYGTPSNSSRPGGPMTEATFTSATANSTFHLLADNSTVISLISSVTTNCSTLINNSTSSSPSSSPPLFNDSDPFSPRPEQAVQYYRASTVVLTLDGYNDTAALSETNTTADTPLPSWIDTNLLNCLNDTIGAGVPLVDSSIHAWQAPSLVLLFYIWIVHMVLL